MNDSREGIVLALGGGGARGFAHVGVLESLHARGVPIAGIVGTSSGAVAGAGYCLGYEPPAMRERVMEFAGSVLANHTKVRALVASDQESDWHGLVGRLNRIFCQGVMVKSLLLESSLLGPDYFQRVVDFFLPEADMAAMPIPFAVVATDLANGCEVVIKKGSLRRAVLASSSVPGVAPPVELDGHILTDGGVVSLVPSTAAARLWPNHPVVAVSVDRTLEVGKAPGHALECYIRASDIQGAHLSAMLLARADLSLVPDVGDFHWADFVEARTIMDAGFAAAEDATDEIEALMERQAAQERPARPGRLRRLLGLRGGGE